MSRVAGVVAPANDLLKVNVIHPADDVCVIEVVGEIDLNTAATLDSVIAEQCAVLPSLMVLELRKVRFIGSSGLASLMAARDCAKSVGSRLRLVCAGPTVLRPMDLTGLTELFEVYPDTRAALRGPPS